MGILEGRVSRWWLLPVFVVVWDSGLGTSVGCPAWARSLTTKGTDLRRDPRFALHRATVAGSGAAAPGEVKIIGRAFAAGPMTEGANGNGVARRTRAASLR